MFFYGEVKYDIYLNVFVIVCVDEMLIVGLNVLLLSSDDIFVGNIFNIFIFVGVSMVISNFFLIVEFILNSD